MQFEAFTPLTPNEQIENMPFYILLLLQNSRNKPDENLNTGKWMRYHLSHIRKN